MRAERRPPRRVSKSQSPRRAGWLKTALMFGLKLGLVMVALLGIYGIYLDSEVKARFGGGPKWQLPAQVYGQPLDLSPGTLLRVAELIEQLQALGYREVGKVDAPGDYRRFSGGVELYARDFLFAEGAQPSRRLEVRFNGARIASVKGGSEGGLRLEPQVLARLDNGLDEDRQLVKLEQVPTLLTDTLMLVEDRDFYHHFGVSPLAIARAMVVNLKAGRTVQGGSTLTQQLAKNYFLTQDRTLVRKLKEVYLSLLLERRFSKEQILEAYLNEIYLGQSGNTGIHGFGLAARFYFGRQLDELRPGQMAMLVGMVRGPSLYDPWRRAERARERRDLVLRLQLEHGKIDEATYQRELKSDLGVQERSLATLSNRPAMTALLERELKQFDIDFKAVNGLRVFTTIDPLAQRAAEAAVAEGLQAVEKARKLKSLQAAQVVIDPVTGAIRAIIGDRSPTFAGFNRAVDAKRPIGSLIKPVVYLAALSNGSYHLGTMLADMPVSMNDGSGKRWQPQNYDRRFRGTVSLIDSLANSLNVPTVNLGMALGLNRVAEQYAKLAGEAPPTLYPSALLGAMEMSPVQVAQFYQPLAHQGERRQLRLVLALQDADGKLLAQAGEPVSTQVADPRAVFLVEVALNRVTREGTAKSLAASWPGVSLAGKTGTTNDGRDAWFVGFDRRELVVTWVGRDDNSATGLTGGSGALPLHRAYLLRRGPLALDLANPNGVMNAHFDPASGALIDSACGESIVYPAIISFVPEVPSCADGQPPRQDWWDLLLGAN